MTVPRIDAPRWANLQHVGKFSPPAIAASISIRTSHKPALKSITSWDHRETIAFRHNESHVNAKSSHVVMLEKALVAFVANTPPRQPAYPPIAKLYGDVVSELTSELAS